MVVAILQEVLTSFIGPNAVIRAANPITPALGSSLLTSTPFFSNSILYSDMLVIQIHPFYLLLQTYLPILQPLLP